MLDRFIDVYLTAVLNSLNVQSRCSAVFVQEVSEALHFNHTARTAYSNGGFHLLNVDGSLDHRFLRFGKTNNGHQTQYPPAFISVT